MTETEAYHSEQIEAVAVTQADLVSAFTLGYPEEAIGIVRATRRFDLPPVVSFTVETDGRLPIGISLNAAITSVDKATGNDAEYFLINCAHPDHFSSVLEPGASMERVRGVVVNASRSSHAELDESENLDAGDPEELGMLVGDLCRRFTHLRIIGGCRGARTETHDTRSRKGPLAGGLSTHSARQKKGSPSP